MNNTQKNFTKESLGGTKQRYIKNLIERYINEILENERKIESIKNDAEHYQKFYEKTIKKIKASNNEEKEIDLIKEEMLCDMELTSLWLEIEKLESKNTLLKRTIFKLWTIE